MRVNVNIWHTETLETGRKMTSPVSLRSGVNNNIVLIPIKTTTTLVLSDADDSFMQPIL